MELVVFATIMNKKTEPTVAELIRRKRDQQSKIFVCLEKKKGWYYHFTVVMIVISLGLGIGSTVNGYDDGAFRVLRITVEVFLLIVFLTEYGLRIWSSGAHGTYGAVGGWKKYVVTPHMIIDLLVILSSLGLVISTNLHMRSENQRLLYLLQLLRVLRIDRQRGAFSAFWLVFKRHRKELLTCWYMGFLMVIFVSFLVYALEEKAESKPHTLDNLFDGVYWGVISLTTIGYGDINPETTTGKILICCFAIFGTCFLAMPAGIIGSGFALQVAEQQKEKHVNRRRRPAAVLIQCFWRKYAADNDYTETWKQHTQSREEKLRKATRSTLKSEQMFGAPFTPILHSIQVTRNDHGKASSPTSQGDSTPEDLSTNLATCVRVPAKTLTSAEKIAVRFIRFLKCITSTKKFRQARRPYDERDILDQFASSQIEMFAKVRDLRLRIDSCQNSTEKKTTKTLNEVTLLDKQLSSLKDEVLETKSLLKLLLKSQGIKTEQTTKVENPSQSDDSD